MIILVILLIFIINFWQHSHYYFSKFWCFKEKIKVQYNYFKSSQYLFNFLYLAELVRNSKLSIPYLATVRSEVNELAHHFRNMGDF